MVTISKIIYGKGAFMRFKDYCVKIIVKIKT